MILGEMLYGYWYIDFSFPRAATSTLTSFLEIYLSALAPPLALLVALYTLLATTVLLVVSPLFLLLKHGLLRARFYCFLAPPLKYQLGLACSSHETNPAPPQDRGIIGLLLVVNIFAPIYATVIAVAAWVGGAFWFYTAILGNPDGRDQRDDGREAIFTVNRWWERWLIQGLE